MANEIINGGSLHRGRGCAVDALYAATGKDWAERIGFCPGEGTYTRTLLDGLKGMGRKVELRRRAHIIRAKLPAGQPALVRTVSPGGKVGGHIVFWNGAEIVDNGVLAGIERVSDRHGKCMVDWYFILDRDALAAASETLPVPPEAQQAEAETDDSDDIAAIVRAQEEFEKEVRASYAAALAEAQAEAEAEAQAEASAPLAVVIDDAALRAGYETNACALNAVIHAFGDAHAGELEWTATAGVQGRGRFKAIPKTAAVGSRNVSRRQAPMRAAGGAPWFATNGCRTAYPAILILSRHVAFWNGDAHR